MKQIYDFIPDWNEEYCGVILRDGQCLRLPNHAKDTRAHFELHFSDIPKPELVEAIWHTHIDGNFNLSIDDYHGFLSNPEFSHLIVTELTIAHYEVESGYVLNRGLIHVDD